MSVGDFIKKKLASHFKMQDAYSYFQLLKKIGHPSEVDIPPDLLPMAGKMFTRAGVNQMVFQISRDWVLPYWAVRQFTPGDVSFIPRMGWASFNLTHRNWAAVGNLDSDREVTIDPRGLVTPWFEAWSVDFWLKADGKKIFPSQAKAENVNQTNVDQMPIIETTVADDSMILKTETFAGKSGSEDNVYITATVENRSDQAQEASLYLAIRPYNPEGLFPIEKIEFTHQDIFMVDDKIGVISQSPPDGIFCCDFRTGDCSHFIDDYSDTRRVNCQVGLATAFAQFKFKIPPGKSESRLFVAPTKEKKLSLRSFKTNHAATFNMDKIRTETVSLWEDKKKQGLKINIPDKEVQKAFNIHKCYLNLFDDGHYITPGVALYHHYWFRDSAYMVAALDNMGYPRQAKEKLLSYPGRQRSDGFFLSQDGEWDSNGQAIWTLVEHYRMTGDRALLAKMYGSICKGARWIKEKTAATKDIPSPHYGLLPPGFSAEHFGPNDYFYWDDFWALAGLRDACYAAEVLGHPNDQLEFADSFAELDKNVKASLSHAEIRLNKKVMPTSPYRRFDSAAIGTACVIHPLKIMDPNSSLVKNTAELLLEQCFIDNGFFQDMIHSGINIYLSLHVAQILAAQHDPRAWDIANKMLLLATGANTWPEAVNLNTGGGAMGDGMHGWATADFLLFVRNTLINEDKEILIVTPCVPKSWYDQGKNIKVENAPTHFGEVSFSIEGKQGEVILTLDAKWRKEPEKIQWVTPFDVNDFSVDSKTEEVTDGKIIFFANAREIRIGRKN